MVDVTKARTEWVNAVKARDARRKDVRMKLATLADVKAAEKAMLRAEKTYKNAMAAN